MRVRAASGSSGRENAKDEKDAKDMRKTKARERRAKTGGRRTRQCAGRSANVGPRADGGRDRRLNARRKAVNDGSDVLSS